MTTAQLADLQAGLLDDQTAAELRRKVRVSRSAIHTLRGLEQTRTALAALGHGPAPDVPPDVTRRIGAALRSAPPPRSTSHAVTGAASKVTPAHADRPNRWIATCGASATVIAIGAVTAGTVALLSFPHTTTSSTTSASRITATPRVPLSSHEIAALVSRSPDFGSLADPKRRSACLRALGYPEPQQVLGAQPVQLNGKPAVVLVLAGQHVDELVALTVTTACSAIDTGLVADTTIRRP